MIICTMTTASHLFRAKVMAESAKAHHKDARLVLCLIEKRMHPEAKRFSCFDHVLLANSLPIPNFDQYLFMRKVHEASYALKGHLLKHLLNLFPSEDHVVFLDTDTEVLSPMTEVAEALERHPILLTPHELHDAKKSYMLHGIINIGFIALKRSEETLRFLDWWIDRVDRYGFDESYAIGLFYEQNWLNLALAYYDIHVLTHPGYNVAYWNLHERGNSISMQGRQFLVDGLPIRFFHFSHVAGDLLQFMGRYITGGDKAMHILRSRYLEKLKKADMKRLSETPWSYDRYDSGKPVASEARIRYRMQGELAVKYPSPFKASNEALIGNKGMTIVQLMSNAPYAYPLPPFNQGGTEKVVYDLTEELVRRGHRVYVYAPAGSKTNAHVIPYPAYLKEKDIADFVAKTLPAGTDIIHDHTFSSVVRYRKWRMPAVCTHHIPINNRVKYPIYVSKRALEILGGGKGYAVYNGICQEEYEFSEEKQDYLLFMGRLLPSKGVHLAIRVAELAGKKLIIAGPVKDEEYFNQQLRPKFSNPDIEYVGAVGGQRKLELLKHASCLLFPSTYEEPFGLTMIEAMVSGTPVLALRHGAAPEVLAGFPDLICGSTEEMVHKLLHEPFPSPEELREYVLSRFTVRQMTDHYLQIYQEVGAERKPMRSSVRKTVRPRKPLIRTVGKKRRLVKVRRKRSSLGSKPRIAAFLHTQSGSRRR